MLRVKSPDVRVALEIYYSHPSEIGNAEIKMLFGCGSPNTVARLKKLALEQMERDGKKKNRPSYVNTQSAYKAWGIDIEQCEIAWKQLQRLKLVTQC